MASFMAMAMAIRVFVFMVMLPWLDLAMAMADESVDAPRFTTVHTESHFDIRLYRPSSWMTAPLSEISFEIATLRGFHK